MKSFAWVVIACGCTSDVSITGTFRGEPFDAVAGYYSQSSHGSPSRIDMFTTLRFTSVERKCGTLEIGSLDRSVDVTISIDPAMVPAGFVHDTQVHAPGVFPVSFDGIVGARSAVGWTDIDGNFIDSGDFTAGYVRVTSISDDHVEGSLDVSAQSGEHVQGDFSVDACTTFYY